MKLEYNGYTIEIFMHDGSIAFKIVEEYLPGKFKVRRKSICNKYTGKRDHFGEKLYTPFETEDQALERAKNYIDNFIVKWVDSPHYNPKPH